MEKNGLNRTPVVCLFIEDVLEFNRLYKKSALRSESLELCKQISPKSVPRAKV